MPQPRRPPPPPAAHRTANPPGRSDWSDDKLAGLDAEQLKNVLKNLDIQRVVGQITAEEALDCARRIAARAVAHLEPPAAIELAELAADLSRRYADTLRRRSTEKNGSMRMRLALSLLPDHPQKAKRYLLLVTDEMLLASGVPITGVAPASSCSPHHSRDALRARPGLNVAETERVYAGLIARLAVKRSPR